MRYVLYAGAHPGTEFVDALRRAGREVRAVASLADAQKALRTEPPAVAVLDMELDAAALREALISLLMIDARVHAAVVTDMAPDVFEDAMEGLGVLLPLPSDPGAAGAKALLCALEALKS